MVRSQINNYKADLNDQSENVQQGILQTRRDLVDFLWTCVLSSPNTNEDGWPAGRVYFLGFGQGGSIALDLGLYSQHIKPPSFELGGIISISGWLIRRDVNAKKVDVLVTYGSQEPDPSSNKRVLKDLLGDQFSFFQVQGKSQGMPQEATEVRAIMSFLGSRLALRNIALESQSDVYEIKMK